MITGITKQTQFGVDATHHKVMEYNYDKAAGKVKIYIHSFPSASVAGSNKTPLLITQVNIKLEDLTVTATLSGTINVKKYLNDARDLLEQQVVLLPDWVGGIVS
jgi:hypothetical protein